MAKYIAVETDEFGVHIVMHFKANNVIDAVQAVSILYPNAELYARVRKEGTEDTDADVGTELREDYGGMDYPHLEQQ